MIGAGVVGCAAALALARRGVDVVVLEAEPEPALAASGTNSGILHTGFDSTPGELETELLHASSALRDAVIDALQVPVLRCGALMRPRGESERAAVAAEAALAGRNRVSATMHDDGTLEVPGEAVTDPVRYTLALAAETERQGGELRTAFSVAAIEARSSELVLRGEGGGDVRCRVVVNCAGLHADAVARLAGDDSFSIFPRKGEFLVFDPPGGEPLERILMPVPSAVTRGVLVFPTVDGKLVAGPTAVDIEDKRDWSARAAARDEVMPKAAELFPPLLGAEPIAVYVGLRPAGRGGVNYLIGASRACPALVNVAAIRSTGLSASLGIAERVAGIVGSLGVALGDVRPLRGGGAPPPLGGPWWQRTATYRSGAVTR